MTATTKPRRTRTQRMRSKTMNKTVNGRRGKYKRGRWTDEEKRRLAVGIHQHGIDRWEEIASLVVTR